MASKVSGKMNDMIATYELLSSFAKTGDDLSITSQFSKKIAGYILIAIKAERGRKKK